MGEVITETYQSSDKKIKQCDIFRNIEFLEYTIEKGNAIEISKIIFPFAIILTQACDLQQDYNARQRMKNDGEGSQDKYLMSVIVAPLYNFEDFRLGEHLNQLGLQMENQGSRSRSKCTNIIKNENKRYHYLKFDQDVEIVDSVIDFKHYFSVTVSYLNNVYEDNYVCSIKPLYRELITQRFSNFLSRIGLPDPE